VKKHTKPKTHSDSHEFLTVEQLAGLLHLNPMTIYRLVKSGKLPVYVLGRVMRFRRDDLEDFLAKSRVPSQKTTKH